MESGSCFPVALLEHSHGLSGKRWKTKSVTGGCTSAACGMSLHPASLGSTDHHVARTCFVGAKYGPRALPVSRRPFVLAKPCQCQEGSGCSDGHQRYCTGMSSKAGCSRGVLCAFIAKMSSRGRTQDGCGNNWADKCCVHCGKQNDDPAVSNALASAPCFPTREGPGEALTTES